MLEQHTIFYSFLLQHVHRWNQYQTGYEVIYLSFAGCGLTVSNSHVADMGHPSFCLRAQSGPIEICNETDDSRGRTTISYEQILLRRAHHRDRHGSNNNHVTTSTFLGKLVFSSQKLQMEIFAQHSFYEKQVFLTSQK